MKVKAAHLKCRMIMESILRTYDLDEIYESDLLTEQRRLIKKYIVNYNLSTRDFKRVLFAWDIEYISRRKAQTGRKLGIH